MDNNKDSIHTIWYFRGGTSVAHHTIQLFENIKLLIKKAEPHIRSLEIYDESMPAYGIEVRLIMPNIEES